MKRVLLGLCLFAGPVTWAQQPGRGDPRIGYVFPAGGQQGTTFQIEVGGQNIGSATNALFSGTGIVAEVLEQEPIITQGQLNELREKLQKLRQQPRSENARKEIMEIQRQLERFEARRRRPPALVDTVQLKVTIAADAEPSDREIRLGTPMALSNPLVFQVGQLPEFLDEDPKKPAVKRDGPPRVRRPGEERGATPPTEASITLPATVNGQILPGAVDRFRFHGRKGQQLVVAAYARALIPYLADAVPGWFQATLTLYDAKGRELAYDDDYRFHPDPVLSYRIAEDGDYVLEVKDALYRGREDFVYRVAIGELPFVTSVFPLGGPAGAKATVNVHGWNLPVSQLTLDTASQGMGTYPFWVCRDKLISNRSPFSLETLPECQEKEPNNSIEKAQPVKLPVIINGRIGQPGDTDVFRLKGRAGDEIVAEVLARRLDSPLDSMLKLVDAEGRQLALNDDYEDKGTGLNTHHADSYFRATLPADGTYFVYLDDTTRAGGSEYAYRLRLSPPRPDFELRTVPSSLSIRGGTSIPFSVFALRKDGFTNEIAITLRDAPAGFKLSGGPVPAGQDQVKLTLTASPSAPKQPVSLFIEGRATIQGREVIRDAVPAEDMMQAFAYRHLVPSKELKVYAAGRFGPRAEFKLLSATPVKIPLGGTARLLVEMPMKPPATGVQFELNDPPQGISILSTSLMRSSTEIVLRSDSAKSTPGAKGSLIVNVYALRTPGPNQKPNPNQRRAPLGSLPAIPFEIVAP